MEEFMKLKNLNELAKSAKSRYTNGYKNREVKLHNAFRTAFENYLQQKGDTIKYLDYSAEITVNTFKNKIFLPNQWFCISTYLVEFVNELIKYKNILEEITDNKVNGLYGNVYWNNIKDLNKNANSTLNEPLKGALVKYFGNDTESLNYMIKFLTKYEWWIGSKTIDRADYYVYPVMKLLELRQVAQAYIADIVYAFATNELLMDEALRLLNDVELNPIPSGIAMGAVNMIIYGAPGTGKSRYVEDSYSNITRVVFHLKYSYSDFIGHIIPVTLYKDTDATLKLFSGDIVDLGEPLIDFRFVPGPFIETIISSFRNPENIYTLVIEDINMASVASVFGDMIQLLERRSDGNSEYKIKPSEELNSFLLSQKNISTFFNNGLFIPSNMNIVATMSSSGQDIFIIDSTFTRRWKFKYIPIIEEGFIHENVLVPYGGDEFKWKHLLKCINNRLKDLKIDEDRLIGPYFINVYELSDNSSIKYKLFIYLWDDVLRHKREAFNEGIRTRSELISAYSSGVDVLGIYKNLTLLKSMEDAK